MFNPESPPEMSVSRWFNSEKPLSLKSLKGKVVVVAAFQQACSGSLRHGIPQASRLEHSFSADEVRVIGLHMDFESSRAGEPASLEGLIEEHGITFPVGMDAPNGKKLPKTMAAYEIRGTPTLLLFDRQGRLRRHYLGAVDDIRLAAEIMALVMEPAEAPREASIAVEQMLARALVDPQEHEHGDACGCNHDHEEHGHLHHDHDRDRGPHPHAHGQMQQSGGKAKG